MAKKALIAAAILFLPAGCADLLQPVHPPPGTSVTVEEAEAWRGAADEEDARALDALPQAWANALADLRRAGFSRRIAAEGPLLAPAAGLPRATPAPGAYLCRMLRLGSTAPSVRLWSESAQGFCFVGADGDQLSLTIEVGPRRIGGYFWEEKDSRRLVFLGSVSPRGAQLGAYGEDSDRNAVGLFERVGPFRYRLTLPGRGDARLAVVELTPAPEQ